MARSPSVIEDRPSTRRVGALRALMPFIWPYRIQVVLALIALSVTATTKVSAPAKPPAGV